jgi:hypothetical protein
MGVTEAERRAESTTLPDLSSHVIVCGLREVGLRTVEQLYRAGVLGAPADLVDLPGTRAQFDDFGLDQGDPRAEPKRNSWLTNQSNLLIRRR